jgi:hypothetical protein
MKMRVQASPSLALKSSSQSPTEQTLCEDYHFYTLRTEFDRSGGLVLITIIDELLLSVLLCDTGQCETLSLIVAGFSALSLGMTTRLPEMVASQPLELSHRGTPMRIYFEYQCQRRPSPPILKLMRLCHSLLLHRMEGGIYESFSKAITGRELFPCSNADDTWRDLLKDRSITEQCRWCECFPFIGKVGNFLSISDASWASQLESSAAQLYVLCRNQAIYHIRRKRGIPFMR